MNTQRLHLTTVATMIVSMMGVGCASSAIVDAPSEPMAVREAQKSLVATLSKLNSISVSDVKVTRQKITFKAEYRLEKGTPFNFTVKFADLRDLTISRVLTRWSKVYADGKPLLSPNTGQTDWFDHEDARTFVNCLLNLRNAARAPDTEEADFAAFSAAAKPWLAAESKPPMSDDARSSKAMAEDAFKKKDFAAAMDAYVEALGKHPMWPEGHYNAALLAGEIEDYEVAARHMRRYLVLAPDAKDAFAAKDKYLLWRAKSKS